MFLTCILKSTKLNNHTLSASNALLDAVFPVHEVVLISSAAAVVKHLASLGLGVECKPPLYSVTCPPVHRSETQLCGPQKEPQNIRFKFGKILTN